MRTPRSPTIAVIEAANAEEEALAIAVALREAVETPDKTAALVTPDRALARRVLAALARWNVPVDDSGGDALADTPAGVFARLAAEAALGGLAPVTLLALLKHPLLRLGADAACTRAIATLERAVLRGPRPKPGTAGLAHALATFRDELAKFRRKESSTCTAPIRARRSRTRSSMPPPIWSRSSTAALAPLEALRARAFARSPFAAIAQALATDARRSIAASRGIDGEALATAFDEIARAPARFAIDAGRLCRAVPRRRSPTASVRRPEAGRARAHLRPARSAAADASTAWCSAGWSKASGRRRRAPIPWLSRPMRHDARPRSAGAAHRPLGARFRAGARRAAR